jgi:2,5-diamino-6-(ribosylamino)-4(3H)-pyrimidinone 5'-phosphate reductase
MMDELAARVRPLIWVNCAISLDGKLALARGERARLSGAEDLERVQRLRAESDAILIGVGTAILDDPSLRVHWELLGRTAGPPPTRIILDSHGRLPAAAHVLDGSQPTIVAVAEGSGRTYPPHVDTIVAGRGRVDLPLLFGELARRGIGRVMVEGGAQVLASVLVAGLFDRFTVYVAPVLIGGGGAPPLIAGPAVRRLEDAFPLTLLAVDRLGAGFVASYAPGTRAALSPP